MLSEAGASWLYHILANGRVGTMTHPTLALVYCQDEHTEGRLEASGVYCTACVYTFDGLAHALDNGHSMVEDES